MKEVETIVMWHLEVGPWEVRELDKILRMEPL
jgi:hypothetical protein